MNVRVPRSVRPSVWSILILSTIAVFVGCNIFDPLDGPGNNAKQILSAARACFDKGDLTCALEWYEKLPSSYGEIAASEEAFVGLEREGVGLSAFAVGISKGDAGKGITELATRLIGHTGAMDRIYENYKAVAEIKSNIPLRGFTRFLTALALTAAVLSQDGNLVTPAVYTQGDLAADPTACLAAGAGGCIGTANCDGPGGAVVLPGAAPSSPSLIEDASNGTLPTNLSAYQGLGIVSGAIAAIAHALTNELVAGGNFNSGSLQLANSVASFNPAGAPARCFRFILLQNRFGVQ